MVEVTDADIAAVAAMHLASIHLAVAPDLPTSDQLDALEHDAFAAHRIAAEQTTVDQIVAWLRESAAWHDKHDDGLSGFDGIRQGQSEAADAIEQGDWHND